MNIIDSDEVLNFALSENFKLKEFIYLQQWEIFAFPPNEILDNLKKTVAKAEEIRKLIGKLKVNSGYRPTKYNKFIGGALKSQHTLGLAADVFPLEMPIKYAMELLIANVGKLEIRIEILPPNSNWIHFDLKAPTDGLRLFYPVKKGA